jgi:hypothetical protein
MTPTPLSPREFFATPWEGTGEWQPLGLGRLLPQPRRLRFRSWTTPITDEAWLVHDETTWENGRIDRRDGVATILGPTRLRLTYDDMPGGTHADLREDGFSFAPYRIAVPAPILPVMVLVSCRDECVLGTDGELVDSIEIRCLGLALGRLQMRLRRQG